MTQVFYVNGAPGSGKTWLCQKLKERGVECVDVDGLVYDADHELFARTKRMIDFDASRALVAQKIRDIIRAHAAAGTPVCFVGIQFWSMPREGVMTYFIEFASEASLREAYARFTAREIQAYRERTPAIVAAIRELPLAALEGGVYIERYSASDIGTFKSFDEWQGRYTKQLAKERGYRSVTRGTHAEILADILRRAV